MFWVILALPVRPVWPIILTQIKRPIMVSFERIKSFEGRKKSSLVAEKILEQIELRILNEGERLPPERTIAEQGRGSDFNIEFFAPSQHKGRRWF